MHYDYVWCWECYEYYSITFILPSYNKDKKFLHFYICVHVISDSFTWLDNYIKISQFQSVILLS